jgi:putative redox protein
MTAQVHVRWAGEHRFDASRPGGPTLRLDGSGATGQSPVDGLLSSLASCMAADVVDILAKRRTPVSELTVDVIGKRVESVPKRFEHIMLQFTITGAQIEQSQAERAIDLSYTKYCSVRASLREDIVVEWKVDVKTVAG